MAGVCESTPVPPSTITLNNPNPIPIPNSGQAGLYPSMISVPPRGPVLNVTVRLLGINHPFPDDIDVLLVGPQGQTAVLMSDVGGNIPSGNVTLTLNDGAPSPLPDNGPLVTSTFRPTNIGAGDTWPPPAPPTTGGPLRGVFNGTIPTGPWALFVFDDQAPNSGQFAGGWNMSLLTQCSPSFAQGIDSAGPPGAGPPPILQPNTSPVPSTSPTQPHAASTTEPAAPVQAGTGR